ncbi:MAG: hypothetical protein AB1497_11990 [Bacillota bacterium]
MRKVKEPIKNPLIWVGLIVIILLTVPWYLPASATRPVILGFPLWAALSGFFTIVLSAFLTWVLSAQWDIEEPLSDSKASSRGGDTR